MAEQTLEQRRAAHALGIIKQLRESGDYKKYPSYVSGFSPSILTNGLGQAAATLLAQAKGEETDDHAQLYKHLELWLCGDDPDVPYRNQEEGLIEAITTHDQDYYLRAQAEALVYLVWLKKFATAFLKEKDNTHVE